jgi:Flp pilus assembly protein TadB
MKNKQSIVDYIYRKDDIEKLDAKLKLFGISQKYSVEWFLNMRFFTTILVFVIIFLLFDNGFIFAPILTVIYYFGITYLTIDKPLKKRGSKLEHEAFYYFEVLTLSLEAGRNLEMAIESACTYIESEISSEFKETLYQVKFGKSLSESLNDMRRRIPSEAVNNIILNVMQSSIFGNSIIDTMYSQLDFLRDKQIMEVKAEISKIPTKISVFSVLFFVPLIMLLIIAPIVIDYINKL